MALRGVVHWVARGGMAVGYLGFAAMKAFGGPAPGAWLDRWGMHWPSVVLEIVLGTCLLSKYWRQAAYVSLLLCGLGALLGLVIRDGDCGCGGAWLTWSSSLHVMVVAAGGIASAGSLLAVAGGDCRPTHGDPARRVWSA